MFYDSITKFVFIYKSLWKLGERTDAISMIKWQIEKIISKQCFLAFPVKTVNYILTWFLYVLRRKAQLQIYKTRFVMASIQFIRDKFLARRKQFSLHFNWTASKYELRMFSSVFSLHHRGVFTWKVNKGALFVSLSDRTVWLKRHISFFWFTDGKETTWNWNSEDNDVFNYTRTRISHSNMSINEQMFICIFNSGGTQR